jgi:hypothetical protein
MIWLRAGFRSAAVALTRDFLHEILDRQVTAICRREEADSLIVTCGADRLPSPPRTTLRMSAKLELLWPDAVSWSRRAVPALYLSLVTCAVLGAFLYKLRVDGLLACPASYGSNAYLTDCNARAYGDYDHGAFWFGLEREAQRAAAEAQVLLLGNSRLQFAFSDVATSNWFARSGISYYLLGFSNSENTVFFSPMLTKIRARPKVYVINVDRFFDDRISPPMEQILRDPTVEERYRDKQKWQSVHRLVCTSFSVLCGTAVAVYRDRTTGRWVRDGTGSVRAAAVSDDNSSGVETWNRYARLGEEFIERLPVERSCIILTIVPTVHTRRAEAEAIASRLGLDLFAPDVDGLRTFDGSHLDRASAERWSAAFLREVGAKIRACVGQAQSPS